LTVNSLPTLATTAGAVTFNGATGINTLIGPSNGAVWNITGSNAGTLNLGADSLNFTSVANLTGSATDVDTFNVVTEPKTTGKLSGKIDGQGGGDVLNYAGFKQAVTVNLQTKVATQIGSFANIASFVGTTLKDTMVGPNLATNWDITGANAGNVGGADNFTGFENLTGGTLNDTFTFETGASVSGKVVGGKGTNTLDYSADTAAITVNLQTLAATGTAGFTGVKTIDGNGTATTLIGANTTNTWNITGLDSGSVGGTNFAQVNHLTGGTGNDTFTFADGTGIDGGIDGGKGTNVLNYAAYTTPVTVNLATLTAMGASTIANFETFTGGTSTSDTLISPDTVNTWNISSLNTGKLNTFSFKGFENLTGGASPDRFVIAPAKLSGVTGHLDGGAGNNTLAYSAFKAAVGVDLTAGTATDVGGGVSDFNILIGGSGADHLTGSTGRDLIFGGAGADTIDGGAGDDMLFDSTPKFASTAATLDSLLTFWNRNDLDYLTRVTQLRAGSTGVKAIPKMTSANVSNDTSVDHLTGGDDHDWFFANLSAKTKTPDVITDLASDELTN
jgi:hypothetical protein